MILADAATAHPDGTVSMLRAWINQVFGPKPPFLLRAALAVRIEGSEQDHGQHRFAISCLAEDGSAVLPTVEGDFEFPKEGGATSFVVGLQAPFQSTGLFRFSLRVDGVELQDWPITASLKLSSKS